MYPKKKYYFADNTKTLESIYKKNELQLLKNL